MGTIGAKAVLRERGPDSPIARCSSYHKLAAELPGRMAADDCVTLARK